MLKCPNCGQNLVPHTLRSKYGEILILDQCEACGGIWFDEWELYSAQEEEIKNLEKIEIKKPLSKFNLGKGNGRCPKCQVKLEVLKDPFIPREIEIKFCPECRGLWLKRGEATEYKEFQKKKEILQEGKEFNKAIEKILQLHKETPEAIFNVAEILSTPLNPLTLKPILPFDSPEKKYSLKIIKIAKTILDLIFRMVR